MVKDDPLLSNDLNQYMKVDNDEDEDRPSKVKLPGLFDRDELFFGRIIRNVHNLRDCWRRNQPKTHRINCDSFVLSVMLTQNPKTLDTFIYCGLNNGDLQMWSPKEHPDRRKSFVKVREMEVHRKGVKCLGVEGHIIVTGSYDCTAKVWSRLDWGLLHTVSLHTDSVWEIKLRTVNGDNKRPGWEYVFATAGLDGIVGLFNLKQGAKIDQVTLSQNYVLQVMLI